MDDADIELQKLAKDAHRKRDEIDKDLEAFINDDPELLALMREDPIANNKSKKKKIINEDDRKYFKEKFS